MKYWKLCAKNFLFHFSNLQNLESCTLWFVILWRWTEKSLKYVHSLKFMLRKNLAYVTFLSLGTSSFLMNPKVSCPSPTLLTPLFFLRPIPFISLPNLFATEWFHCLRISGSGCFTKSRISIIFPVASSNTAIARCDGIGTVSPGSGVFFSVVDNLGFSFCWNYFQTWINLRYSISVGGNFL